MFLIMWFGGREECQNIFFIRLAVFIAFGGWQSEMQGSSYLVV